MAASEVSQAPLLGALVSDNAEISKQVYTRTSSNQSGTGNGNSNVNGGGSAKRQKLDDDAPQDPMTKRRFHAEYAAVETLPASIAAKQPAKPGSKKAVVKAGIPQRPANTQKLLGPGPSGSSSSTAGAAAPEANANVNTSLTARSPMNASAFQQVKPEWHPPWKLMRVISGHLGWVRSLAVEPGNKWFASGAGDRTIKIWDLATGSLRLTLTGHISTVRGLAVSPRHPYLFSCGEDKLVKCWDLETNKVIRHYHGHLSGVYTLALHPTLDVLVTGGRDGVARVWDMRTRNQVHVLTGHTQTVSDLKCQEADPQVITGSLDSTVRMWDLAAGKTMGALTHHKKGVRALATHPTEFTFASGSTGSIKQWKCPEGAFMQNFEGHNAIINTLSVNQNNVFFSGGKPPPQICRHS
jgi:pleiotropic regulator 1